MTSQALAREVFDKLSDDALKLMAFLRRKVISNEINPSIADEIATKLLDFVDQLAPFTSQTTPYIQQRLEYARREYRNSGYRL